MDPANAALWFIESHFRREISLDEIAERAGVTRFHMSRLFPVAMGQGISQYVRGRRLTEAARTLASGAPDILAVALDVGYGSHEAFTRAFREQFGVTPEAVRAQRHLDNLVLVEAIRMDQTPGMKLEPPRFVNHKALLVAGLGEHFSCDSSAAIPALWQRFVPLIGHIPGQVGNVAYGVCYNTDEDGNLDYIAGCEVSDFSRLQPNLTSLRIPAQRYAVFAHKEHVSTIRRSWDAIWRTWLPESGHQAVDAPALERYAEDFNSLTGFGGIELWVPIKG
jgi:AraC family transcriptional regulator